MLLGGATVEGVWEFKGRTVKVGRRYSGMLSSVVRWAKAPPAGLKRVPLFMGAPEANMICTSMK